MGESIIIMFCDREDVFFTVLTDCCCCWKSSNLTYNHVEAVFNSKGIKKIDAFIWTHPDQDHSMDIIRILENYDSTHRAEVFIPEGLISGKDYFCDESKQTLDYIYQHYSPKGSPTKQRHIHTVSTEDKEVRDLLVFDVQPDDLEKPLRCKFRFVLPYTEHCHHAEYWDTELTHNLMSVVYSIEINSRNYVFTGDLLDRGTRQMSSEILSRMNYLKIPHHGSVHSNEFLAQVRTFEYNHLTSTVTRFNRSHDPKERILRAYAAMGDVYHVTNNNKDYYGCIETTVDIANDICTTRCDGSADKFM